MQIITFHNELSLMKNISIRSERFLLRTITVEDATVTYLSWLQNGNSNKFISSASPDMEMEDLREFIVDRNEKDDVIFLAIIDPTNGTHIGNIKYEPVVSSEGYALMGILIGDEDYRGKNVAGEVIISSANWLKENLDIRMIWLGVHVENLPAIKAYQKIGFLITDTPYISKASGDLHTMVLNL